LLGLFVELTNNVLRNKIIKG